MITDDGCRLWTSEAGSGRPLVFCHGGPGLWDYFEDVAARFTGVARTVRWDQRGCGRSERRGPCTIDRAVADLDAVRGDAERIDLLGHSWGAELALRYALRHPGRVRRLVYVSGTGVDPDGTWGPAYERNLRARLADEPRWWELSARDRTPDEDREHAILQWTADFADPATAHAHASRLGTPWFGIARECAASLRAESRRFFEDVGVPALCRDLTVPVLIVDGARDIRPRSSVDSLAAALPDVRRVVLADAGHVPWAEDPDGFHRIVRDFLAG